MKLKDPETVLLMLLKKMFMEDLRAARLCASDTVQWVLKDQKQVEERFEAWLVQNGYAETPMTEKESYAYNTMCARATLHPGKSIEEVWQIIEKTWKERDAVVWKAVIVKPDGSHKKVTLEELTSPFCGCNAPMHQRTGFNEVTCMNCRTVLIEKI